MGQQQQQPNLSIRLESISEKFRPSLSSVQTVRIFYKPASSFKLNSSSSSLALAASIAVQSYAKTPTSTWVVGSFEPAHTRISRPAHADNVTTALPTTSLLQVGMGRKMTSFKTGKMYRPKAQNDLAFDGVGLKNGGSVLEVVAPAV